MPFTSSSEKHPSVCRRASHSTTNNNNNNNRAGALLAENLLCLAQMELWMWPPVPHKTKLIVHICNPSTQKQSGKPAQGYPWLCSALEAILGYKGPCVKKKNQVMMKKKEESRKRGRKKRRRRLATGYQVPKSVFLPSQENNTHILLTVFIRGKYLLMINTLWSSL